MGKNRDKLFKILLAVACVWPVILLLVEHPWYNSDYDYYTNPFPWVTLMFDLIVLQACILLAIFRKSKEEYKGFWHEFRDPYRLTFSILFLISLFLAPFWLEEVMDGDINHWMVYIAYLVMSALLHFLPLIPLAISLRIPEWVDQYDSSYGGYYYADLSSGYDSYEDPNYGATEGESWLDDMSMTKNYYGMHGEFDRYDEARRISEDIQQFHSVNPDADLLEQYNWEDVLDAETDGYLDD